MANLFRCGGGRTEASYQNLMDQLIEETATGPIASFTDGANNIPTKEVICHINPTETGTREKSPSNPYVIGGFTECNITNQSTIPVTDNAPYLFRQSGGDNNADVYNQETDKLVGASAVVNQLAGQNARSVSLTNFSVTYDITTNSFTIVGTPETTGFLWLDNTAGFANHIYYGHSSNPNVKCSLDGGYSQGQDAVRKITTDTTMYVGINRENKAYNDTVKFNLVDLTAMFGTAIADYVYSLEQATAGSGIAYLRKYGFFTKDYYPYTANALQSVNTSKHIMQSKNLWNGVFVTSGFVESDTYDATYCYAGNDAMPIREGEQYCGSINGTQTTIRYVFLNQQKQAIGTYRNAIYTDVAPSDAFYLRWRFAPSLSTGTEKCQIESGTTSSPFVAYSKHEYALPNIDLRGLYKLDASNNLYADGDTLEGDGTLTRKYEQRPYQSGDESLADAITDGTNTVVKLATPTTEQVTGFTNPQIVDKYGTEEYVDERDFPLPVGHETIYLPTGQREYTVPFGQTVYGGELILQEGQNDKLIPWEYIASYNGEVINEPWVSSMDAYAPGTTPTTGAFVCYPAADPAEITLPTKTVIPTLLGANNIYHDCNENIDVTYRANGALYVQEHPITRALMAARPTEQIQEQEEQQEEKEINKSEDNER